jgi:hypothetical protein
VIGFVDASLQRHEGGGTYLRTGIDVYVEEMIATASQRRRGVGYGPDAGDRGLGPQRGGTDDLARHTSHQRTARGLYGAIGCPEVGVEPVKEL